MAPLSSAIHLAAKAHSGQKRACGGPYIEHPLAVARILMEASTHLPTEAYLVAVLHDVLEDTAVTYADLAEKLGRDTAAAVAALTRLPAQDVPGFLAQIRRASGVYAFLPLIKAADRIHNLETAGALDAERRERLYDETRETVLPFLRTMASTLPPDFSPAFEALLQRLALLTHRKSYLATCARHPTP